MQQLINKLKAFYVRNRIMIIAVLGFLIMMQLCSRGGRVEKENKSFKEYVQPLGERADSELKPLREIYEEDIQGNKQQDPGFISLLLIIGLVLLFYVGSKRGWLQKLMPSIVWVSVKVRRLKTTKERIGTITIVNQTKESLTFSPPVIAFGGLFKKARKFRIKSGEGQDVFPLTLMPGTSHQIAINLDIFKQKAEGLDVYGWVKVIVDINSEKSYSSIWKYLF